MPSPESVAKLVRGKTFSDLKKEADRGNHEMQMLIGLCYEFGIMVDSDEKLVLKYQRLASASGGVIEETNFGMALTRKVDASLPKISRKDQEILNEALVYFERAARKGGILAAMYLAAHYSGEGIRDKDEKCLEKARQIFESIVKVKDAEDIIPDAFWLFGLFWHNRFEIKHEMEYVRKAADCYLVSALRGDAHARTGLLSCYYLLEDHVNMAAWEKIIRYEGGHIDSGFKIEIGRKVEESKVGFMKINARYNELLQEIKEKKKVRKQKTEENFMPWSAPGFVFPENVRKEEPRTTQKP